MDRRRLNRVGYIVLVVLSLTALLDVIVGYTQPPLPDEGTLAHVFQLSIVALAPAGFLFLVTADWAPAARTLQRMVLPAVLVVLAFAALYYLEHYYHPAHYR